MKARNITVLAAALSVLAALLFGVSGCDSKDKESKKEEITAGVVIPITGVESSAGLQMRHGFELAVEELNGSEAVSGRKIRLVFEDNGSDPDKTAAAAEKLIRENQVPVILGPYTSGATEKIIPVADREKVVIIGSTSAATGLSAKSEYLFRPTLDVARLTSAGVRITKQKLEYGRVATITNEVDTFASSLNEELTKALRDNGVAIASAQTFSRPTASETPPDLSEQMKAIKNLSPAAEVLFISAQEIGIRTAIVEARRTVGSEIRLITSLVSIDDLKEANKQLAGSADGVISFTTWSANADTPANMSFVRSYREKYSQEPDAFAALSYASVYLLAKAVSDSGATDSRSIRNALAKIQNQDISFLQGFSFDENGDAVYDTVVEEFRNGRFEIFKAQ